MKENKLRRQNSRHGQKKSNKKIMKGDKLGRQGGSIQDQPKRGNHERDKLGRQGGRKKFATSRQFWKSATMSLRICFVSWCLENFRILLLHLKLHFAHFLQNLCFAPLQPKRLNQSQTKHFKLLQYHFIKANCRL